MMKNHGVVLNFSEGHENYYTAYKNFTKREIKSRRQLAREAHSSDCVPGCDFQCINFAREVLKSNNIHPVVFGSAFKDLLMQGRSKFRNVILVG